MCGGRFLCNRFRLSVLVTALTMLLGLAQPGAAFAQPNITSSGTSTTATLKELLEKGLKARRPQEFAFVARVVEKVNSNELPESLVKSTFLWARTQPEHHFQYFQFGLRMRAKKIGVVL